MLGLPPFFPLFLCVFFNEQLALTVPATYGGYHTKVTDTSGKKKEKKRKKETRAKRVYVLRPGLPSYGEGKNKKKTTRATVACDVVVPYLSTFPNSEWKTLSQS